MKKLVWGILGCGDVAEVKSGPAFQKIYNSELLAVMRRNAVKAEDFAKRHNVPTWYNNAEELLKDSRINAIYIATPPSTHVELTLKAIQAGKNIYLEKPMAINAQESARIIEALNKSKSKLTVAHYRRKLPAFLKVKELLENMSIGEIRFADIQILQSPKSKLIADSDENWRIDPAISGGGYFHDLAPHQIDLMYQFFGEPEYVQGISGNQNNLYPADDIVNGIIRFKSGVQFRGIWCFNASEKDQKDECTIFGSHGSISFSFFGDKVVLNSEEHSETFDFEPLPHVQQPMIKATVDYFLGNAENPCSAEDGLAVMNIMDRFCS
ncbi:Gfo/Idh/MocA family protein [Autumnicola psychrophila]|uniref:Gfo/Idh/MocA family oxidoreductase n=1 Tax=Autumnicola psychrophila TaxID=3075592 RepID=A0ABU3DXF9_9FLAO|nr:Gfo/Idh/MocA family oxidoreductase [Zunongwangia sp. F225]MDT0687747.1 Gfo/Idh/MocA family oxidoreductase [Zunongwangia sp. F225]